MGWVGEGEEGRGNGIRHEVVNGGIVVDIVDDKEEEEEEEEGGGGMEEMLADTLND